MIIIDTREDFEFQQSHVEGAINISPSEFMTGAVPEKLAGVDRNEEIILYCRSGSRSNVAKNILQGFGFSNVTNGVSEGRVRQLLQR